MTSENKKEIAEMVSLLKQMDRDELIQTYGFALGLKAKIEPGKESISNT